MPEEWLCTLGGLNFAPNQNGAPIELRGYAATQLFLQRARQIDSAYHPDRVDTDSLRSIGDICRRTAGMPLALEMAAAWVQQMPCAEIAASLDGDLALLTRPITRKSDRHASMHAVFEHSWHLLDPDLRHLLARLSVLRGHFDREAATAVAGGTLFSLSALLDKSLLESTGDGRYQVHELLRQFSAEKLALDPDLASTTREAHSVYYCRLCRSLEEDLKGGDQVAAAQRLEDALGNLRVAVAWAAERGAWKRVADASFSLGYFCSLHGRSEEGSAIFAGVCDALDGTDLAVDQAFAAARASYWLGQLADGRNAIPFWTQAKEYFESTRASALGGSGLKPSDLQSDFDEALLYRALASTSNLIGENTEEERCYQIALTAARRAGDVWIEATILNAYADLQVWTLAHYQGAWEKAGEALRLQRSINDRTGMVETLGTLCAIETFLRHYERAIQVSEEQLVISQTLGNDLRTAMAHRDVGWALLLAGRFDECLAHLRHAHAIYSHHGQDRLVAETLYGLSWRSCMGGHYEDAHRYADELATMLAGIEGQRVNRAVLLYVRSQLALHEERFAAALEYAQESCRVLVQFGSHNQEALARITLGFAHLALNDLESAESQARLLLGLGTTAGLWGLGVVALVLVKQDPCDERYEQFYELLALQHAAAPMCDAPSYRAIIQHLQPNGLSELSPGRRAAAEARGRALDPDETIAALREQIGAQAIPNRR